MKLAVILVLFLAMIFARGVEPVKPRIDGHGDGEITLPITLKVIDSESADPLSGLDVVFYSDAEEAMLRESEAATKAGRHVSFKLPAGTRTCTSSAGLAELRCRFEAAFLWSFESGIQKDVGTDVFPSGRFVISDGGSSVLDRPAREIFTEHVYTPEKAEQTVIVRVEKRTDKLPEQVPGDVAHR